MEHYITCSECLCEMAEGDAFEVYDDEYGLCEECAGYEMIRQATQDAIWEDICR